LRSKNRVKQQVEAGSGSDGRSPSGSQRSLKHLLKSSSGRAIRAASRLVPKRVLFQFCLVIRRIDACLRRAGSPRALGKAVDHAIYSLRQELVKVRIGKFDSYIRLNDPFHYDLVLGLHEPAVGEWLSRNLRKGMTVVDVGANVGSYTLLIGEMVGREGRVFALEADPETATTLRKNVELNGQTWVEVIEGAAYKTCGEIQLGRAMASTGYSGLYYEKALEWIRVPALTLDSLVERIGLGRIDLVKIDVEGAENDVLEGMKLLLGKYRPTLLIELHPHLVPETTQVPARLEAAGYSVELLDKEHIVARPQAPVH
jgi:FkbM family methyltransferase